MPHAAAASASNTKAAAQFLDFRPTLFFGVPTSMSGCSNSPPMRRAKSAASCGCSFPDRPRLPPQILEEFRARFGHTILERYGMSETLMNIVQSLYRRAPAPGTVGLPLPGVSARIRDGEMQLRGPNIFAGYWRREEATRAAFDDGWFKTGDMAECSPDGYYTLLGRKSDLIISGGFNIYPREIEEFLEEQEEVAEAAVVGMPDRLRGEVPVAYVVARKRSTRHAGDALPRKIRVVQDSARVCRGGEVAAHRAGKGAEAPAAAAQTEVCQTRMS